VKANGAPSRLGNKGNTLNFRQYGTAGPGGGGAGPTIDSSHEYGTVPDPLDLRVRHGSISDPDDETTAHLSWSLEGVSVNSIKVQRRESSEAWVTIHIYNPVSDTTDHYDSTRVAGVNYSYRLIGDFNNGQSLLSNTERFNVRLVKGISQEVASVHRTNKAFSAFVASVPPYYRTRTTVAHYSATAADSTWTEVGYYNDVYNYDTSTEEGTLSYIAGSSNFTLTEHLGGGEDRTTAWNSLRNPPNSWTGTRTSDGEQIPFHELRYGGWLLPGEFTINETTKTYTSSSDEEGMSRVENYTVTLSNPYTDDQFFIDSFMHFSAYGSL